MRLFPKFQVKNRTPANPANPANPVKDELANMQEKTGNQVANPANLEDKNAEIRNFRNAPVLAPEQEATPAPATVDMSSNAADPNEIRNFRNFRNPVVPDQTPLEPPARKDRLCYECQYFQRSPYGYPIGLCQQHGDKNEHPNGRVQHSTSRPTQFGCGEFTFRQASDDSKTCIDCRHYNPMSTMCSQVNTGCPYPSIPPCGGEKFQRKLRVIKSNKETAARLESCS